MLWGFKIQLKKKKSKREREREGREEKREKEKEKCASGPGLRPAGHVGDEDFSSHEWHSPQGGLESKYSYVPRA